MTRDRAAIALSILIACLALFRAGVVERELADRRLLEQNHTEWINYFAGRDSVCRKD